MSMIRKYHNHKLQTTPWHREEEPLNHHETPGRQIKQNKTAKTLVLYTLKSEHYIPGRVAQSVTCLATDGSLTADPGVASLIQAQSHTFVEIDHEIIPKVIPLPSAESFKKGCCQLQAKVCARNTG